MKNDGTSDLKEIVVRWKEKMQINFNLHEGDDYSKSVHRMLRRCGVGYVRSPGAKT